MSAGLTDAQLAALKSQKPTTPAPGVGLTDAQLHALAAPKKNLLQRIGDAAHGAETWFGQHVDAPARERILYAQKHPGAAVTAILGAPQRMVGEYVASREEQAKHPGKSILSDDVKTLGNVAHAAIDASPTETARATESIRAAVHAPTHAVIDKVVDGLSLPAQVKPYLKAIGKGGEDFALQTISDPLTAVDGLGIGVKLLANSAHGAQIAHVLSEAAKSAGMGRAFDHLAAFGNAYMKGQKFAANLAQHIRNIGIRPELDEIFSLTGKRARLSIENKWYARASQWRADAQKAVKAGNKSSRDYYLQFLADHGDARARAQIEKQFGVKSSRPLTGALKSIGNVASKLGNFVAATPEDKLEELDKLRKSARTGAIAAETSAMLKRAPDALKPGVQIPEANIRGIPTEDSFGYRLRGALAKVKIPYTPWSLKDVFQATRAVGRAGVFLNPAPHEVKNVGQLMRLAGGVVSVPRAFFHAMKPSQAIIDRLDRIGALPTFFHGAEDSIWSRIPGLGPKYAAAIQALSEGMRRLDIGYRSALLENLDRMEGKSANVMDEYSKGRTISEQLGDPRNQDAFVRLFETFGGPFVAFRLGIAPRNVLAALVEHPSRVVAGERAAGDVQANRSPQGQAANELTMGGPIEDTSELLSSVAGIPSGIVPPYLTSAASIGPVGNAILGGNDVGHPVLQGAARGLAYNIPGGSVLENLIQAANGSAMPNQKMSLADKLVWSTLTQIPGWYLKREPSPYTQERQDRTIERQENQ